MKRQHPALALLLTVLAVVSPRAEIVDRIVATVGKRVITLSHVQEAHRFESLIDQRPLQPLDRARIREIAMRLVDQALLEQEMLADGGARAVNYRTAAERQLAEIRKGFGSNGDFHHTLEKYGLTEADVLQRLELQATVDRFIESRFRPGVQVDEAAVERYYRETLLPELRARGVTKTPSIDEVRDQIEEILVQQRITTESEAWLKNLRDQGQIRFR